MFDADPPASHYSLRTRLEQLPNVLRRAVSHPTWLAENVRMLSRRRAHFRGQFSLEPYKELVCTDEQEAITELLGVSGDDYRRAKDQFWSPSLAKEGGIWDARDGLQSVVSLVVRLMEPRRMVETGVGRGLTSAVALGAMREAGVGHLYSIDFPPVLVEGDDFIGTAIPDSLRDRWTLRRGPSRVLLPELMRDLGQIDVSLHDADHTYRSQLEEFQTVWPRLTSGGVLICDDVESPSLTDFAESQGLQPVLIPFPGGYREVSPVGMLRKP